MQLKIASKNVPSRLKIFRLKLIIYSIPVMSIFSVVRFPNTFCYGTEGYNGTCLTSAECSAKGGTAAGSCASGFGVCCTSNRFSSLKWIAFKFKLHDVLVFLQTCGSTATLNNTYWQNPGFSSSYTGSGQCSFFVQKASSDICQIRWIPNSILSLS